MTYFKKCWITSQKKNTRKYSTCWVKIIIHFVKNLSFWVKKVVIWLRSIWTKRFSVNFIKNKYFGILNLRAPLRAPQEGSKLKNMISYAHISQWSKRPKFVSLHYWRTPQGCQGCQKIWTTKLKFTLVSWSAKIQPKLKKLWKTVKIEQ